MLVCKGLTELITWIGRHKEFQSWCFKSWLFVYCSNEGLTLKSNFQTLYGGHFTLSIQLITLNYLVILSHGCNTTLPLVTYLLYSLVSNCIWKCLYIAITCSWTEYMYFLVILDVISYRRTGVPLNIKARKDSFGFENIDDYFLYSGRATFVNGECFCLQCKQAFK